MVPILYKMTSAYHQHPFYLFFGFLFVCFFPLQSSLISHQRPVLTSSVILMENQKNKLAVFVSGEIRSCT